MSTTHFYNIDNGGSYEEHDYVILTNRRKFTHDQLALLIDEIGAELVIEARAAEIELLKDSPEVDDEMRNEWLISVDEELVIARLVEQHGFNYLNITAVGVAESIFSYLAERGDHE